MRIAFYTTAAVLFLLFSALAHEARADDSIMFEVGWRFDNVRDAKRNAFDFGAIRYNNDGREVHVATWADDSGTYNVFAAGIGYVLDADDSTDGYVSFTPGIAITSSVAPVRMFTRAAVGYADGDMTYEAAHNAYIPLIEREVASDAFATIGVAYNDYDNNGNGGRNNDSSDGDAGDPGDGSGDNGGGDGDGDGDGDGGDGDNDNDNGGGDSCKPGHGYGDANHCHSGPPGRS